jgi:hypothetical protein
MRGRGLLAAIAGVLVLALVGVGCGSDSSSGGSGGDGGSDGIESTEVTESSISKAQYIKKAEAVCEKATEQLEADFGTFVKQQGNPEKPSEAVYEELLEAVVTPNISVEIEELSELEVPEGDADEIEAMLEARVESIEIAEEEPKAIIQNTAKVFAKASKVARAYGLKACANR